MAENTDESSPESSKEVEMFYLPPPKVEGFTSSKFATDESFEEKIRRKTLENPFVPAGALVTTVILGIGLWTMKTKNTRLSQKMMRARVAAQFSTIAALVGGMIYAADAPDE